MGELAFKFNMRANASRFFDNLIIFSVSTVRKKKRSQRETNRHGIVSVCVDLTVHW